MFTVNLGRENELNQKVQFCFIGLALASYAHYVLCDPSHEYKGPTVFHRRQNR